jgi:hypothetical protein
MKRPLIFLSSILLLAACKPEVGSPEWCEMMGKKPKGDWTFNETADYTKHCIIK